MGDDITVRQFSKTDLLAIAGLQDRWLATIFANKKTYSTEEIKVMHRIAGYFKTYVLEVGRHTVKILATDDALAIQFARSQYILPTNIRIWEKKTTWRPLHQTKVRCTPEGLTAARQAAGRLGAAARWKQKEQEHGNQ